MIQLTNLGNIKYHQKNKTEYSLYDFKKERFITQDEYLEVPYSYNTVIMPDIIPNEDIVKELCLEYGEDNIIINPMEYRNE